MTESITKGGDNHQAILALLDASIRGFPCQDPRQLIPSILVSHDLANLQVSESDDEVDFSQGAPPNFARLDLQKIVRGGATALMPKIIIQEVARPLQLNELVGPFAVEFEYSYYYFDYGSRLDQAIRVNGLPVAISQAIRSVQLKRLVDQFTGDLIYGQISFRPSRGFSGRMQYDIAIVTRDGAFALDGTSNLRALTAQERENIEKQGIRYSFSGDPYTSWFRLQSGQFITELRLGTSLKQSYIENMFGSNSEWVTESEVTASYGDYHGTMK